MVDVMVAGVVGGDVLKRIPGQGVAAVIVHCFEGRGGEEYHTLSGIHSRDFVCYACT